MSENQQFFFKKFHNSLVVIAVTARSCQPADKENISKLSAGRIDQTAAG